MVPKAKPRIKSTSSESLSFKSSTHHHEHVKKVGEHDGDMMQIGESQSNPLLRQLQVIIIHTIFK